MTLPTVVTSAGLQPQTPAQIAAQLTEKVTETNPGYTNTLPGSLIEDISSTEVAGIAQMDQSRIDAVNSVTPYGVNDFLLAQMGAQFGITIGTAQNTSVFILFTGTPGFVVNRGFIVSDGNYQYVIQDGGIVGEDTGDGTGVTDQLFAVATISGSWAVPSGTVNELVTEVPGSITLTCTNPQEGIPATEAQTAESYRAAVIQAGLASVQGTPTMLKTLLGKIDGVQARLISFYQDQVSNLWRVICGGGDPYKVGYAIAQALGPGITLLTGSVINVVSATKANPGVYTTDLNHGLSNGQLASISDSAVSAWNVTNGTVTVVDEKRFSMAVNTSGFATYTTGGVVTPNERNITVSITDYPDSYDIIYISPPQQTVEITLTWNTDAPNFVSQAAVAQQGAPAIAAYINSIVVGQPINLFEMQDAFKAGIANILDPSFVSRMVFMVTIDSVATSVVAGTGLYEGDPESYFLTDATGAQITINQG